MNIKEFLKNLALSIFVVSIIVVVYFFTTEDDNTTKMVKENIPETKTELQEEIPKKAEPIITDCIQVITNAKNPETQKCEEFPTPCDVPAGWVKCDEEIENESIEIENEPINIITKENNVIKEDVNEDITKNDIEENVTKFKTFYLKDSNTGECNKVYAIQIENQKEYKPEQIQTIMTLLQPLSEKYIQKGYVSVIPKGTRLKNLWISNGVAEITFNPELTENKTQCELISIKTQITQTLLQFPEIEKVMFMTNIKLNN